jgi:hypothetical protein
MDIPNFELSVLMIEFGVGGTPTKLPGLSVRRMSAFELPFVVIGLE